MMRTQIQVFALRDKETGLYLSYSNRKGRISAQFETKDRPRLFPSKRSAEFTLNSWRKLLGMGTWHSKTRALKEIEKDRMARSFAEIEVVEFNLIEMS